MNTTARTSDAAFDYMSNHTLRLRRKINDSPQVEGLKLPLEGCVGTFNRLQITCEDRYLQRACLRPVVWYRFKGEPAH